MFVVLSAISVLLVAPSAFAEPLAELEDEPAAPAPALTLPAACSIPEPGAGMPGIHFAPTTPTNFPGLRWDWSFVSPETPEGDEPFAMDVYDYAIYNGATLQSQGTLDKAATTLGYAAPVSGNYSLYLWTVQGNDDPAYCSVATIALDTDAPVIINNGHTLNGSVATPLLSTEETDLTYSWTVNGLNTGVEISDPTILTPTFTFLKDGTYNFALTATDSLGNSTTVLVPIIYVAPFVIPPTGPEIIPEEIIPLPVEPYVPLEEAAPVTYRSAPVPSGDGRLPAEVDAAIYSTTVDAKAEQSGTEKEVAGAAIAAGQDGWKVMGLSWYWWILVAAIIATAWLWVKRTVIGRVAAPDDV